MLFKKLNSPIEPLALLFWEPLPVSTSMHAGTHAHTYMYTKAAMHLHHEHIQKQMMW